jgi:hypothetical protein
MPIHEIAQYVALCCLFSTVVLMIVREARRAYNL